MSLQPSYIVRSVYCALRGLPVLGVGGSLKFLKACFSSSPVTIKPKGYHQGLTIRGGTSDVETFFSIIIRESYPAAIENVKTIIDAGANVGYAAAYFSHRFPGAKIYALEPENGNFRLLKQNTAALKNVTPVQCALWSSSGELFLQDASVEPWAFQYGSTPAAAEATTAYSMADLMDKFEIDQVDLLKIDIEGAEKEVFSGDASWVDRVRTIFVEIHDRFVPGSAGQIFRVMSEYDYDFEVRFEYVIFEKIHRAVSAPVNAIAKKALKLAEVRRG